MSLSEQLNSQDPIAFEAELQELRSKNQDYNIDTERLAELLYDCVTVDQIKSVIRNNASRSEEDKFACINLMLTFSYLEMTSMHQRMVREWYHDNIGKHPSAMSTVPSVITHRTGLYLMTYYDTPRFNGNLMLIKNLIDGCTPVIGKNLPVQNFIDRTPAPRSNQLISMQSPSVYSQNPKDVNYQLQVQKATEQSLNDQKAANDHLRKVGVKDKSHYSSTEYASVADMSRAYTNRMRAEETSRNIDKGDVHQYFGYVTGNPQGSESQRQFHISDVLSDDNCELDVVQSLKREK